MMSYNQKINVALISAAKALLVAGAMFIVGALLFLVVFERGCDVLVNKLFPFCGNDIVSELPSPDKRFKAVVFQRDCGATTGFSTQISIIPFNEKLGDDSGGNIFVANDNNGNAPLSDKGTIQTDAQWKDSSRLRIIYDKRAKVYKNEFYEDFWGERFWIEYEESTF